jgi:uncharacterized damage-inducible protein DinB
MSDEHDLPATHDELLTRIEQSRTAFYAALEGLSDEQLGAPLTERGWSIADHMAHIAVWMDGVLGALDGRTRWEVMGASGPPEDNDFDTLNEHLRTPHAAKAPAEARAWLEAVHAGMVTKLSSMSREQLHLPYRHYQPDEARSSADEPILNWVVSDTYAHYEEHQTWITAALAERGWK